MDELYRYRSFANSGGHSFDRTMPHIAHSKDTWHICFQEKRIPIRRPTFGTLSTLHQIRSVRRKPRSSRSTVAASQSVRGIAPIKMNIELAGTRSTLPVSEHRTPGITHTISGSADQPCRVLVMGFRIPAGTNLQPPPKLVVANMDDLKEQTVAGHLVVLYKLLVGDRKSKRDRIAAGDVVTSLFLMDFAPGGTNTPHHHETAEEIYLILDGHGKIVAGGGEHGVEGLHAAHGGDAYFFRLNCTVGFYNSSEAGAKADILAVRSRFPFHAEED